MSNFDEVMKDLDMTLNELTGIRMNLQSLLNPVAVQIGENRWECGVCKTQIDHMDNYCRECGRRLRWT